MPRLLSTARLSFTLIEMLVIIAIIAILFSLMAPSLRNAINSANGVSCANNQKQIYLGISSYLSDNNLWMPTTGLNSDYVYYTKRYHGEISSKTLNTVDVFAEPDGLFFCPAVSAAEDSPCWSGGSEAAYYVTNYVATLYNTVSPAGGGWLYLGADGKPIKDRRFNSIKDSCIILGEMNYSATGGSAANSWNTTSLIYSWSTKLDITNKYRPAFSHNNSANFIFKDGHFKALQFTGIDSISLDFIPLNQ